MNGFRWFAISDPTLVALFAVLMTPQAQAQ